MVHQIGSVFSVYGGNLPHFRQRVQRIQRTPPPAHRNEREALTLNGRTMFIYLRCYQHSKARISGSARNRQAVKTKIPVFRHQKQNSFLRQHILHYFNELVRPNSHYNHHRLVPAKHQQGPEKDIIQLRLAVYIRTERIATTHENRAFGLDKPIKNLPLVVT